MTTLRLFEHRCGACANEFRAPVLAGPYGDLLVRSAQPGSERVFPMDEAVADELSHILDSLDTQARSEVEAAKLFQCALSIVLDRDLDGSEFEVSRLPACPACGSSKIQDWWSVEPPLVFEEELPVVSHEGWSGLSEHQKRVRVKHFLEARESCLSSGS